MENEDKGNTSLLIQGARRIGKSCIADQFGYNEYRSHIIIDFNKVGDNIKELFINDLSNLDSFL